MTTQPQLEDLIDVEEQYQVATYKKFPFVVDRGGDVWVYTTEGERYLDLYDGRPLSRPCIRASDRPKCSRIVKLILLVEPGRQMVDDDRCSHRRSESAEYGLD